MRISIFIIAIFVLSGCSSRPGNNNTGHTQATVIDSIRYAKGFSIIRAGDCKILNVFNPWEGAKGIAYRYVLCPRGKQVPDSLRNFSIIYTPVKRIVCLSTTHIALLKDIGRLNTLVGVAGPAYITDSTTRNLIAHKKVLDVGYDQALNYEVLISLKPDLVLAYGIQGETATQYKKLENLGIKVVLNGEYLETSPLGKYEWVKFLAAFFEVSSEASKKFKDAEQQYLSLKAIGKSQKDRPRIMTGLPWKGAWYVPGGESYLAEMIDDAGGDYLWNDIHQRESVPLNFEKVIERASNADIWINTGLSNSLNDIRNEDNRLENVKPFRHKMIYNNNAITSPSGGNDFWESGITHPQVILKDLIKIFHPELFPSYQLVYYKKLN